MRKKRILIVGATGFFGKNLVPRLIEEKNDVFLTALNTHKEKNLYKLDLTNIEEIKTLIRKIRPNIIYLLGGIVNLSRNFETYRNCIDVNLKGTLNLLEALKEYVPDKLIFTSTEEVYGNNKAPFKEDQRLDPPSGYAVSKIAIEYFCNIYAYEMGFQVIINRIATTYGPEDFPIRFIPQIIKKALENEDIPLNSGEKKRDYVYIKDVIDALVREKDMTFEGKTETINLGGGISYSLKELVNMILKETKSKSKILIGALPERLTENNIWLSDINKAKKMLKWEPSFTLRNGIKETIDYNLKIS